MDKTLILNSIQKHYGFDKNSDFANFLGVSPSVLSNWKHRNTFDVDLLYAKCEDINPIFLLSGKQPMLKQEYLNLQQELRAMIAEESRTYYAPTATPKQSFSQKLNIHIRELGLNKTQYAESLGISRQTLNNIIKANEPTILFLKKIIEVYPELDLNWLLKHNHYRNIDNDYVQYLETSIDRLKRIIYRN